MDNVTKISTRKEIENLTAYVPGKPVEEVQRETGLTRIIKLASNENPHGCSPLAKEAIQREAEQIASYPEGLAPALAAKLANRLNIEIENIIFGNGSDEIISLLTKSYMSRGDEAIMADITFPRYKTNVLIEGGIPVLVPLIDGIHDLKGMFEAISEKTRMIFVCNPNNPTGTIVEKQKLQSFLENVPRHILIIMDEAYYEYVTNKQYLETIPLLSKYQNLVILRTFSKIYGLAGLRIGYGLMHPSIVGEVVKVKGPFNTNRLAQAAAIVSLDDLSFVEHCIRKNDEGRKYLESEFVKMGLRYYPSHANFLMVKVDRSGDDIFQALLEEGIIIRPGGLPRMIRVSVGTEKENEQFIAALKRVISSRY